MISLKCNHPPPLFFTREVNIVVGSDDGGNFIGKSNLIVFETKGGRSIAMSKLVKLIWTVISYAPLMLVCGIAVFIDSLTSKQVTNQVWIGCGFLL